MPKPFAAFDVDGSIFKSSLAEIIVDEGVKAGLFEADAFAPAQAYRRRWQESNNEGVYQAYLHHLVGAFVSQMTGVEVEAFNHVARQALSQHSVRRFGFPRQLIGALRDTHFRLAISGSPELLVRPFLDDLAVDAVYGAQFEVIDGKFTGQATPVGNKADILRGLADAGVVRVSGSVALGDTIGDRSMLEVAEHPIMFNASRTLTRFGIARHWARVNEVKDQVTVMTFDPSYGGYVERDAAEFVAALAA